MSNVIWTEDQLRAIEARGSSLLVSAAAGSGKTAVLVERLLRRICEEKLDITQFLIITYTKAAASELRRKISEALYKKSAENPGNRHIKRQLTLVDNARISTVHSFCMWVLKNYGNDPALAGGFRVLDEAEGRLILEETLAELIEEKYEEAHQSFMDFAGYMSDARSDRQLYSSVLELYNKSMSHPYPVKWLDEVANSYDISCGNSILETVWGKAAFEKAEEVLSSDIEIVNELLCDVDSSAETSELYHDYLIGLRGGLEKALCNEWDEMYDALNAFDIGKRPSSRKLTDKTASERLGVYQKKIKKDMDMLRDEIIPMPEKMVIEEMSGLSDYMKQLAALASELDAHFRAEKLRRTVLDYSDLEHLAIELLADGYDSQTDTVIPSAIGVEVSKNFCEILLDEFQDSNIIQDIIFRAVSRDEKNIVMVGDVKQSIYGFRLADPSIFMKKYKSFARFEDADEGEARCITLARNFRSRSEVLDASNSVFSRIMTEKLGGVDYKDEQLLVPRENIPFASRTDMKCEFCLIDTENSDEEKAAEAEAAFIASKVCKMVSEGFCICDKDGNLRPVKYGDFAILLRSTGNEVYYEQAFSRAGIPVSSSGAVGLLGKSEVSAVIAYLSVIDNPTSDIQLLATLRSPLFGFSADDLCEIRTGGKGCLIYAMEALAKGEGRCASKCREFLDELSELRAIARGMSVGALIWEVYNRRSALGMFGALPHGRERQKNLIELYKCAESLEGLGYFGLYRFISHIARLSERGGDIQTSSATAANSVTIMTMHKSKGLEFPVVFIGGTLKIFNTEDSRKQVLIHPKLGVGLKCRDEELGAEYSTVLRDIIRRRILEEQKSEEMRLLYVAMTRAREKLYIVASNTNAARMLASRCAENAYPALDRISLASRNDAQLWFILPLMRTKTGAPLFEYAGCEIPDTNEELVGMDAYVISSGEIERCDGQKGEKDVCTGGTESLDLSEFFDFSYEHTAATQTPSKITATGKGKEKTMPRRRRMQRPRFMREKSLTPAERGTALHMAMQFADFKRCGDKLGAEKELVRLLEEKYITKAQYDCISAGKICEFVNSDIGKGMLTASKLVREFKFSVLLSAAEMLCDNELSGENVLLQGVMDMYFESEDGITIVDFKTDRKTPEGDTLERYSTQLRIYRRALYEMTGKQANRLVLYLVSRGEYIEIE